MNLKEKINWRIEQANYLKVSSVEYKEVSEDVKEAVNKVVNNIEYEMPEISDNLTEVQNAYRVGLYMALCEIREYIGDWKDE